MRQQNIKCHSQFGRSMVEMLGVLAVVGVISLTMLYGYQIAVLYFYSDQILETMTQRKIFLSLQYMQLQDRHDLSLDEFDKSDYPKYSIKLAPDMGIGFGLTVGKGGISLSKQLCERTYYGMRPDSVRTLINDKLANDASLCEEDGNSLTFYFDPQGEWNQEMCKKVTCSNGLKCQDGVCVCPSEGHMVDDTCVTCPTGGNWDETTKRCVCKNDGVWNSEKNYCTNSCVTHNDCKTGEFCLKTDDGSNACRQYAVKKSVIIGGQEWVQIGLEDKEQLAFDDAQKTCIAMDKSLPNMDELVYNWNNPDTTSFWEQAYEKKSVAQVIGEQFGSMWVWTNNSNNETVWVFSPTDGHVNYQDKSSNQYILCR